MLQGTRTDEALEAERMKVGLVAIFFLPWLLLSASLIAVGVLAMTDSHRFAGAKYLFPVGAAMLTVGIAFLYVLFIHVPRRTIASFELDDDSLTFKTLHDRELKFSAGSIERIVKSHSRRGPRVRGWWLSFQEPGRRASLYLPQKTSHSHQLIEQLSQRLTARQTT